MTQGFTSQLPVPLPTAQGGTGVTSTTAYAVLCGGTTSTGNLQSIAGVGTSGQVLTSNGAGALPTFQTLQTGNIKAWVNFDATGTLTILGSGNISTVADDGVGLFTVNFTNAMSDTNYCTTLGQSRTTSSADWGFVGTWDIQTTYIKVTTRNTAGTAIDYDMTELTIVR